jgi:hypothetical protein
MVKQALAVAERHSAATTKLSLLDRIGGPSTVHLIVDCLIEALTNDPYLAPRLAGLDMAQLRRAQTLFFHDAFGGRGAAEPPEPSVVPVDSEGLVRVIIHLQDVLESFGLPEPLVDQLLLAVAAKVLANGQRRPTSSASGG